MAKLVDVTSQYGMLRIVASELTTVELFNLARTSKTLWTTLDPQSLHFKSTKSLTQCDGLVVARRLANDKKEVSLREIYGPYISRRYDKIIGIKALSCLGREALPCVRCGVNVCEVSFSNFCNCLIARR